MNNLRWVVLGLVVLITIINYLDRGTLNYMWITNTRYDYRLAGQAQQGQATAVYDPVNRTYRLTGKDAVMTVPESAVTRSVHNGDTTVSHVRRGGIAVDLGLVNLNDSPQQIQKDSKTLLAYITMFFMVAYGISQLVSGKLYDKVGTRKGFLISVIIWSAADALTSFARGLGSLGFFRVLLGLGEAGPWPGAVKSNAEWFPVKERALAQGLFGAGGSLGSILAPVIISMLYISFGWKTTFLIIGSLGLLWLIPWLLINKKTPKEHPWITDEERRYIEAGQPVVAQSSASQAKGKSWGELLSRKESYAVILGRFFLDPIWWMFVTWLPYYLGEVFKLDIKQIAFSAWVPYVGAAIGAIAGGWFSGKLIKKGMPVHKARLTAIVTGACIILPAMVAAAFAATATAAVVIMAFVLGGFQFTVVNIQTLPGDYHTGKTVGSLAGLGGAAAVAGTVISMALVPAITENGQWTLFFVMLAVMVPVSVACVYFFSRKKATVI